MAKLTHHVKRVVRSRVLAIVFARIRRHLHSCLPFGTQRANFLRIPAPLRPMPGKIVSIVGRVAPTGCLCCLSVLRSRFFSDLARLKRQGILWMMKLKLNSLLPWLSPAAAFVLLLPVAPARAQNQPNKPVESSPAPAQAAQPAPAPVAPSATSAPTPDRSQAYYHLALAGSYEEDATAVGQAGIRQPRHRGVQAGA